MNPLPHVTAWQRLLKRKLDERDMSQYRLAQILDVSRPTVSAWCAAKTAPSAAHQARLIELLGITPEELHEVYTAEAVA